MQKYVILQSFSTKITYEGKRICIIFQLHHINGNPKDDRLENLQILCPNCHSQTDSYCKRKEIR